MKRLPYRNATYQVIRAAFEDARVTYSRVKVVKSDESNALTAYECVQFIRTVDHLHLDDCEDAMIRLNKHGLAVFEVYVELKPIGTNLSRRTCRFVTGLKSRPDFPYRALWDMSDYIWGLRTVRLDHDMQAEQPDPVAENALEGTVGDDFHQDELTFMAPEDDPSRLL